MFVFWTIGLVTGPRARGALPSFGQYEYVPLEQATRCMWFFRVLVLIKTVNDFTIKCLEQGGLFLDERSTFVISKSAKPYNVSLKKLLDSFDLQNETNQG